MADEPITEAVKFWGGLAGLVTFAFTVWDRAFRARPWIEPHVTFDPNYVHLGEIGVAAPAGFRIFNPGPKAIGIRRVRLIGGTPFRIFPQWDFDDPSRPRRLVPVPAGEARILPVLLVAPKASDKPEATVAVIVDWRPLASRLPRIPLVMLTSLADLRRMQEFERARGRKEHPR